MKKVNVFLADGFEEIEALTVVDMLRRAKIFVSTVSITGNEVVHGAHGIDVIADELFEKADFSESDMLVLPGGLPGTWNLRDHRGLRQLLNEFYKEGRYVAAICAAPVIFAGLGYLNGRKAISHPSMQEKLAEAGAILTNQTVVVEDNVITSQGMGTAIDFSLTIISILENKELADSLAAAIVYV
ncbi:MAG: DJ-1/PfpI family protein [Dorea sp.]|nr:DJ-1/PfpI family protein [Dorea sp.]